MALHALGLLTRPEASFEIFGSDGQWVRGGAETYTFRFQVAEQGTGVKDVLLKACATFVGGASLTQIAEEWIRRRTLLRDAGVATPQLFGHRRGVILEEYIPHS